MSVHASWMRSTHMSWIECTAGTKPFPHIVRPPNPPPTIHTCRGLADLRAGVIRTPLPPKETFLDGAPSVHSSGLRRLGLCLQGRHETYV